MKTILLTGAGGGIGSAIKKVLEESGERVVGIDRADADLASYPDIKALEEKITEEGPAIDWAVFAHGFIDAQTDFEKQNPKDIEATFALNTTSVVYLTQLLLKHLKPGGGIVYIASTAGLKPSGRYAVYSASKAAVNAFAVAMALNKPELKFFSVCPGPTNTPMREKIATDAKTSQDPAAVAKVIANIISGSGGYASGDIIVVRDGEASVATRL